MDPELVILAENYLRSFTRTISRLLAAEKIHYDLVIASGNSGLAVTEFTKSIYYRLKIAPPPALALPIMRFINEDSRKRFDNSVLYPQVSKTLQNIDKNISSILFVDDEIRYGSTVKNSLKLIMDYMAREGMYNKIECTVVADEFGGFNFQLPYQNLIINFRPFMRHESKFKNIILYNVPEKIFIEIKPFLEKYNLDDRTAINLLLDLPVKEKKGEIHIPSFTGKYNQKISADIPRFKSLKEQTRLYISSIIESELSKQNYI